MRRNSGGTYFPSNEQIRERELRVIDAEGGNLGVISRDEALNKAREAGLDLVLIAPNAKPAVARIVDYSKFKYEREKAAAQSRKGRSSEVKELRFRPNIDDNDLNVRINRAEGFLKKGNKVKFSVPFFGRIIVHKQLGYDKLNRIIEALKEVGEIDRPAEMEGKILIMVLKPIKE